MQFIILLISENKKPHNYVWKINVFRKMLISAEKCQTVSCNGQGLPAYATLLVEILVFDLI